MKSAMYSLAFLMLFTGVTLAQIFVAPNGDDTNPGTIDEPVETIQQAQSLVSAGDTVYIRGGLYNVREDQISSYQGSGGLFACISYLNKSGTPDKTIKYWAYPGEQPVFDFSAVKPADKRVAGIYIVGSYIHIKGLEMTGIQVTITGHTESYCIYSRGNNNIFEQISMHNNIGTGLRHYNGGGNLFLNCDAYLNWDSVSEGGAGGNTDGFGCHPNSGGSGNIFRGCRAWYNSDDGFDIIRSDQAVVFDSCWAFYNGYSEPFISRGDGNGFKAGGYAHDTEGDLPVVIPRNTIRFCIAVRNKANGFYANHHLGGNDWYNNTGYKNGNRDFNMLNRPTREDATNIDGPGYDHVLKNNLTWGFPSGNGTAYIDNSLNTQENNSWMLGITIASDDFLGTDMDQLTAPRKEDGSLPDIDFLHPAEGSEIVDAGIDIGFGFLGNAPDLGAIESPFITSVEDIKKNIPTKFTLFQNYPNPFNPETSIRYTLSRPGFVNIIIYNYLGQKIRTLTGQYQSSGEFIVVWNGKSDTGEDQASGIYFYRLTIVNTSGSFATQKKMMLLK